MPEKASERKPLYANEPDTLRAMQEMIDSLVLHAKSCELEKCSECLRLRAVELLLVGEPWLDMRIKP